MDLEPEPVSGRRFEVVFELARAGRLTPRRVLEGLQNDGTLQLARRRLRNGGFILVSLKVHGVHRAPEDAFQFVTSMEQAGGATVSSPVVSRRIALQIAQPEERPEPWGIPTEVWQEPASFISRRLRHEVTDFLWLHDGVGFHD